jgi:hypothetical protein
MAKYRMLAKGYINNAIIQAGEVVEFDGKPGKGMVAIDVKPVVKVPVKTGKSTPVSNDGNDLV